MVISNFTTRLNTSSIITMSLLVLFLRFYYHLFIYSKSYRIDSALNLNSPKMQIVELILTLKI